MELVYLKTRDSLEHPSLLWEGTSSSDIGCVLVHGKAGNFAEKHLVTIAEALAKLGLHVVTSNNRGAYEFGAAREFFNDCILDIQVAIDLLVQRGCKRVVLLGHSYGGMKAAYYVSEKGTEIVAGLVLMSTIPHLKIGDDLVEEARTLIDEGKGEFFFNRKEGDHVNVYSPKAVVNNFEHGYQGMTVDLLQNARLPILSFASSEEWDWFHEVTLTLQDDRKEHSVATCQIIDGLSDHTYTGSETEAAHMVVDWFSQIILF